MDTDKANKPEQLQVAVWAITSRGVALGTRLCRDLSGSMLFLPSQKAGELEDEDLRHGVRAYTRLSEEILLQFQSYSSHIFIFASGIAVRIIAPLLTSKTKDPAVVVMDEAGKFAISLVSGHLGGANDLAARAAGIVGATPVITTATDTNDLPSIDMVAKHQNLVIETPENIKRINMKILEGKPFSMFDPAGLIGSRIPPHLYIDEPDIAAADLICTHTLVPVSRETLVLRPRLLCLGIGCNRGTTAEEILGLIRKVFLAHRLSLFSIKQIGSARIKENEEGLIAAADTLDCGLVFYDNEQLNSVETIENPSEMAKKHLGVRSVCEAAAILGAQKGPLMIPKQKTRNVTLALAAAP